MSIVKRIIQDNIEKVKVDELLAEEYEQAGYGGITLTKTPLGTQINLFAMRPGRVIGKRGRAIKEASERLEYELGLPNPQITVVEVEVPELNPRIMAARIANALERGVHYRRAIFWSLRRTMESGAIGCEILLKGKLRSDRGRYEKVSEGYIPKSGDPALTYVKSSTIHVKQKKGTFGVTVTIVPPDAKFPDKVDLTGLPVIEYPSEEEIVLPEGVEPDIEETTLEVDTEKIEDKYIETTTTEELSDTQVLSPELPKVEMTEKVEKSKPDLQESKTDIKEVVKVEEEDPVAEKNETAKTKIEPETEEVKTSELDKTSVEELEAERQSEETSDAPQDVKKDEET